MSAEFSCNHCGTVYVWKAELAGKRTTCQKCRNPLLVPAKPRTLAAVELEAEPQEDDAGEEASPFDWAPAPSGEPYPGTRGTLTVDKRTHASNPAMLRMQWGKYLACFYWEPLLMALGPMVGAVVVGFVLRNESYGLPIAIGLAVVLPAIFAGWELTRRKEQFYHGDLCPAVVISLRPFLIAAATDLGIHGGPYPAIKIMGQPLGKMTGGPPKLGMRLATIAGYEGDLKAHRWSDFEPIVANCVTGSLRDIQRVMDRIPPEAWELLEQGLPQIPARPKSGDLIMFEN